MNIKNRIKYYLGVNLFNSTPITIETDEKITSKDLLTKSNENNKSNILYDIPLYKILKRCDKLNAYFLRKFGDIANPINKYCFVKNRSVGEEKTIILKSLNKNRHWCNVYNKPNDIPFDKKKNKIIWRGTTTGNKERTGNRFLLVENFFDNKNINYIEIEKEIDSEIQKYLVTNFKKGRISISLLYSDITLDLNLPDKYLIPYSILKNNLFYCIDFPGTCVKNKYFDTYDDDEEAVSNTFSRSFKNIFLY